MGRTIPSFRIALERARGNESEEVFEWIEMFN
jgi:hypothetical protein